MSHTRQGHSNKGQRKPPVKGKVKKDDGPSEMNKSPTDQISPVVINDNDHEDDVDDDEVDYDKIDKIFERMDLNHDGRISVHELIKSARLLGMNPTRAEATEMIQDCNPSEKGYVNKTEFKRIFDRHQQDIEAEVEEIKKAFAVFDKDNSGTISKEEIKMVLKKCGEEIDEKEIDEMLRTVDVDGDGNISIDEFASVMCETDLG